jgi:hypothetical protein
MSAVRFAMSFDSGPRRPPSRPPAARAPGRLDASRNFIDSMLTVVELLPNNMYNILIILDRASRASQAGSIAPSIVRSNGPPRSGLPQFRHRFPVRARCAWYMPPFLGFPWILSSESRFFNGLCGINREEFFLALFGVAKERSERQPTIWRARDGLFTRQA